MAFFSSFFMLPARTCPLWEKWPADSFQLLGRWQINISNREMYALPAQGKKTIVWNSKSWSVEQGGEEGEIPSVGISRGLKAESLCPEAQALRQFPVSAGAVIYAFPGREPCTHRGSTQDQMVWRSRRMSSFNIQF